MKAQERSTAAEGTAQVIAGAAIRLFHDRGYHGTSIRDIAREADVGIATLFHHHGSKPELLQRIIEEDLRALLTRMEEAVAAAGEHPADRLDAAVRAYARHRHERPLQSAIAAAELRSLEGPGRRRLGHMRDRVQRLLATVLFDGAAAGEFTCDHPEETACGMQAMCAAVAVSPAMSAEEIGDLCAAMAMRLAGSRRLAPVH
jgi:AcrR family transcriptional regulator